ncbi:putative PurR-regulated permease PerM [Aquimarina sp. MAR_2010_214]|uniref:AI-2E family transporter n=1 Tax=Aquimarina sp. MAR_2010_214 TaxID=1250026 RepID=UPI000C70E0D0|nr:AI-2E family transporter [Aquimarina sp. MAR_2010_214]PKV50214.1 putative PurR-regulated permease PerM [Aquimarina sp. MAR_2010_214]
MKRISPNIIRQIFVLLLIFLIGGLIFREILPYLSGVLGAITIYVILHRWMVKLIKKGWHPDLAAITLMTGSFVGILMPVTGTLFMLGNKIGDVTKNSKRIAIALKGRIDTWENQLGYDISTQMDPDAIASWVTENLQKFAGGTFNVFISIGIMYFLLYYMLTNRRKLRESLFDYIPINEDNLKIISDESQKMVRSNAIGIPLVAIIQGVVALIGFLIFSIEDPFFWFIIVTVGSMIPFIGTLVAILSVFIITHSMGHTFQAWGILTYGLLIVGSSDNLVRLYILKRLDNVHPIITLLGVIIGVPLFGFIGLIFGPLLISLFHIVVQIYKSEYGRSDYTGEEKL